MKSLAYWKSKMNEQTRSAFRELESKDNVSVTVRDRARRKRTHAEI